MPVDCLRCRSQVNAGAATKGQPPGSRGYQDTLIRTPIVTPLYVFRPRPAVQLLNRSRNTASPREVADCHVSVQKAFEMNKGSHKSRGSTGRAVGRPPALQSDASACARADAATALPRAKHDAFTRRLLELCSLPPEDRTELDLYFIRDRLHERCASFRLWPPRLQGLLCRLAATRCAEHSLAAGGQEQVVPRLHALLAPGGRQSSVTHTQRINSHWRPQRVGGTRGGSGARQPAHPSAHRRRGGAGGGRARVAARAASSQARPWQQLQQHTLPGPGRPRVHGSKPR